MKHKIYLPFQAAMILLVAWLSLGHTSVAKPLKKQSFKEILKNYLFINDFSIKRLSRDISDHIFWRYSYKIPPVHFPIEYELENPELELPKTQGQGRIYQHLNEGRVLYTQKKYLEARNTWLSARARFGKTYPHHRRNDYFIALAILQQAQQELKEKSFDIKNPQLKSLFSNAATFLSWAFIVKVDQKDEILDKLAPKQLYNLAAIYHNFERYAAAYGAAETGLNYLRKTGRKDYRAQIRRILAEAFIQNRTYLDAAKAFDHALRQDPSKEQAAAIFARVGDIYFDLNNYELAEENYALANRIDQEMNAISPMQFVLRGEALFWLGRFSQSQKSLFYALRSFGKPNIKLPLPRDFAAYAHLRIADSYLAKKDYKKAKLEYFRVIHQFRNHSVATLAKIRSACLELPSFEGNNVSHARATLSQLKQSDMIPPPSQRARLGL